MKQKRLSEGRRSTALRYGAVALFGALGLAHPLPAQEKRPAVRLGQPIVRNAGTDRPDAPAILPLEVEIKPPLVGPADGPPIRPAALQDTKPLLEPLADIKPEIKPEVGPLLSNVDLPASPVTDKPPQVSEEPKSSPVPVPVPVKQPVGAPEPAAAIRRQNGWTVYEERVAGRSAPAGGAVLPFEGKSLDAPADELVRRGAGQIVTKPVPLPGLPGPRAPETPTGVGIAGTRWTIYEERVGGAAPIQLSTNEAAPRSAPPLDRIVSTADREAPKPPMLPYRISTFGGESVRTAAAPPAYLPGTLIPARVPGSANSDVLLPDITLDKALVARDPIAHPIVSPAPAERPTPKAVVPPPAKLPDPPKEVAVSPRAALPGEWTAQPANYRIATDSPAVGRSPTTAQPYVNSSRWESADSVSTAPVVARMQTAPTPAPPAPKVAAPPAAPSESKIVAVAATQPKPVELPAATPAYTLMPWQWVERIRAVAGPTATNLVALVSTQGAVKVKFDCDDASEAKAIADRVSAIPEFRRLAIDFDINNH